MAIGQFYFAWVDANETTFQDAHKRTDEHIFSFSMHQSEGDFASMELTIVNPRVGFLAPGRKIWAWLAYEHPTEGVVPMFFGRLVGIPEDLQNEQVQLNFIARPEDYEAQKLAVAETKKVQPYWDPIWFNPQTVNDPDNVLESRPELWHIDRTSLQVTTSNIINGEDGNIALGEADVFYDSVRMHYGSPPVRQITVSAQVSWNQKASGTLNISDRINGAFGGYLIESYTGEGLVKDWPAAGKSLGGGWSVAASFARPVFYEVPITLFEPGHEIAAQSPATGVPFEYFEFDGTFQPHGGLLFPKWSIATQLVLGYDVSRQKTETLGFTLSAGVQSVLTEPGDEEILTLSMQSSELTEPVDPGGLLPLRDQRAAAFFSTDRGTQSIEYLLTLARARLLARARCVIIDCEVPFNDGIALDISCRKNVLLTETRMPGGSVAGKITDYSFQLDGDSGTSTCQITFACTAGLGGTAEAVAGDPDYCDDDYVAPEYQQHINSFIMPVPGELIYAPIAGELPTDDGWNFFAMSSARAVKGITVHNRAIDQEGSMPFHGEETSQFPKGDWSQYYIVNVDSFPGAFRPDYDPTKAIAALNLVPTSIDLQLRSLTGGPFQTDYTLDVGELVIPMLIDLEASS